MYRRAARRAWIRYLRCGASDRPPPLPRQVVQQLEDVGEDTHRRDVCTRARPLHDERRPRIALGRERDDVVAAFGAGEGVIARELAHLRPRAIAFEDAD